MSTEDRPWRVRLKIECDERGLPTSLAALLRHINGNHAAIVGAKDCTIEILTTQRDEWRVRAVNAETLLQEIRDGKHSLPGTLVQIDRLLAAR